MTAGNEDSHTTVLVELVFAVPARYMRLKVLEYHNHPCVHIAYIHNAAGESARSLSSLGFYNQITAWTVGFQM